MPMTTPPYLQGSSSSVAMSLRVHSFLSLRRNQVVSMEHGQEQELQEMDLFQGHVAERLLSLLPAAAHQQDNHMENDKGERQLLSLPFLGKLLDAFLGCEEEFKSLLLLLLSRNPTLLSKPPLDRLVSELLDYAVKSLDICNAATLALDSLRHWHRQADIAAFALAPRGHHPLRPLLGEGQLNRAKKALTKLFASMPTELRDASSTGGSRTDGAWSFGRASGSRSSREAHLRSLSSCISRNWSAAKQVHAMSAGLSAPRGNDAAGLALAVYTVSSVLVLTMSALVAVFLCHERGGHGLSLATPPRHLAWAGPMASLQELIAEEWKKKEKKGSHSAQAAAVLPPELQALERSARGLMELLRESSGGGAEEVPQCAEQLAETCSRLEERVGPFEMKLREVFHRLVTTRAEVQQCLDRSTRATLSMEL